MNGVNKEEKRKDNTIKTLAIVGFVAIIVFAVFLAVQVVQLAPSAFTSLASMAERVHGTKGEDSLAVVTDKSVVRDGEPVVLSWDDTKVDGTYRFSYECTDGVSVSATTLDGEDVVLSCGQQVVLNNDGEATLTVASTKERFVDIPYTISFTEADETEASLTEENTFTVVNAAIPLSGIVAGASSEAQTETEEEASETESESTSTNGSVAANPAPQEPTYTYTYKLPESDPNGFVNFEVSYLGVGEIKANSFVPLSKLKLGTNGAVRFSVKNIGTKTSDAWDYEVLLPNGQTYTSGDQAGLKPNETAILVVGVDTNKTGMLPISAEVTVKNDTDATNNSFSWGVEVTN